MSQSQRGCRRTAGGAKATAPGMVRRMPHTRSARFTRHMGHRAVAAVSPSPGSALEPQLGVSEGQRQAIPIRRRCFAERVGADHPNRRLSDTSPSQLHGSSLAVEAERIEQLHPLNEGRGLNPGDTAKFKGTCGKFGSLNEGRGLNPGDTSSDRDRSERPRARSTKAGA